MFLITSAQRQLIIVDDLGTLQASTDLILYSIIR